MTGHDPIPRDPIPRDPGRLAVFVSGTGRHLQNLCRLSATGSFPAEVALCVSNKPGAGALEHAANAGVASVVL